MVFRDDRFKAELFRSSETGSHKVIYGKHYKEEWVRGL